MTGLVTDRVRQNALELAGGAEWLAALPDRVVELSARWGLRLGAPFAHDGWTAVVMPARRQDGTEAVLKLVLPHMEARDEALGLEFWDGDPTVRLLEAADWALLIERCRPGHALGELPPEERDEVLADLLPRLWRAPPAGHGFRHLSEMAAHWTRETLAAEDLWPDAAMVREALALWEELSRPAEADVLLATDAHAGNVLAAHRRPWLVIDPKPFVGDAAYDATQHLWDSRERLAADPVDLPRRFAGLLGLDEKRVRLWSFARLAAERCSGREEWARAQDLARRVLAG